MIRLYHDPADSSYDLRAAAEYLGITPGDLTKLASRRRLASDPSSPGIPRRFRKSDLDAWKAEHGAE